MAVPAVVVTLSARLASLQSDECGSAGNIAALVQQPLFCPAIALPAELLMRAALHCVS